MECSCGYKIAYELPKGGYGVAEVKEKSGFQLVTTHVGKLIWVCKKCFEKLQKLAEEMYEIVQNKWLYFPILLKNKE